MYSRIVTSAIYDAKYSQSPGGPFCDDPKWPEARKTVEEDPATIPITEKDLEIILEIVVDKLADEISSTINGLRIR